MNTLDIQGRDKKENLETLREAGFLPAVFYGKKTESTSISINTAQFLKVWKEAGESGVVTLKDKKGSHDCLIQSVDLNPLNEKPVHVDFYVFEKGKKREVDVPLEFTGISKAVKDLGGNLIKVMHEVKVLADPQNIPHSLEVDISGLDTYSDRVLASDIKLPAGVELVEKSTEVVAFVEEARIEEVKEEAPVDLSTIEVEKKGKKEEEVIPEA